MAAGDLVTREHEFELRGLLMGPGGVWQVREIEGLGTPPFRTSDSPRPVQHGEFPGLDLLEGRTVRLSLLTEHADSAVLRDRADELTRAWAPADGDAGERDVPLHIRPLGDRKEVVFGRPRRCTIRLEVDLFEAEILAADVEYRAQDPRRYSATESSVSVSPPVTSAGRTYDLTFDRAYGAGTSGTVTATNVGNFGTFPVWTIDGPLTNIDLENATVGKTVSIAISLAVGDMLEVDFQERTVLLNGTASRYNTLTSGASDWWELTPGDNDLRLGADSGSGSATVTWRSAWL